VGCNDGVIRLFSPAAGASAIVARFGGGNAAVSLLTAVGKDVCGSFNFPGGLFPSSSFPFQGRK
jgi:hypothetical protein